MRNKNYSVRGVLIFYELLFREAPKALQIIKAIISLVNGMPDLADKNLLLKLPNAVLINNSPTWLQTLNAAVPKYHVVDVC